MKLTRAKMLERAKARDASYDGRFLTGVTSTGIYCLPSCPAKNPKDENVVHFSSREAARAAGLRPCRRCKPDQFYDDYDPDRESLDRLVARVVEKPGDFADARQLAAEAGIGATKLTGLFREHYHTTPGQFLTAARLRFAQRVLRATQRRILTIGHDAGFESTSAFHESFRRFTGLSPGDFRKLNPGKPFELTLPSDYRTETTLTYLTRDAESVAERRSGDGVQKALMLGDRPLSITIELRDSRARCRVDADHRLQPEAMVAAHEAVCRLLNLRCEPGPFERRVVRNLRRPSLVRGRRGIRMPLTADPFEALVWSIVGQQVNLAFAYKLRHRLIARCGLRCGDLYAHPGPEHIAELSVDELRKDQFSARKAEYVIDSARSIADGKLSIDFDETTRATELRRRLLAVRGLGPWSVEYLLMRGFGFADCVPVGDAGLAAALQRFFEQEQRPDAATTLELMRPFAPWRSLAAFHFWRYLSDG